MIALTLARARKRLPRVDVLGVLAAISVAAALWVHLRPAKDPYADAQALHARGTCGQLKPGTGLTVAADGTRAGWVATMIPGLTKLRIVGPGRVFFANAGSDEIELGSADTAFIQTEGTTEASVLEWKPAGARNWERIPTEFLYPRHQSEAQRMMDISFAHNLPIPGVGLRPSELKDPARLVRPEDLPYAQHVRRSEEAWRKTYTLTEDD